MIVRPRKEGYYEIISGHRRKYAAERLGYKKIHVIIRMMQDDEAVVTMVDSNLQREQITPSEKAYMIDDFADPEFFPGKLKMMEKKRPQNFLLTGMSDLSGWKPEWRDEVFVKIRENPQHQFLFLTKRPDLLDFDTDLENAWFGVTVTRKAELWRSEEHTSELQSPS